MSDDLDDGRVKVWDPVLVSAVHQPLFTYPTDEPERTCRLVLDVHVLRLLVWYCDAALPEAEQAARIDHVRQLGLACALKKLSRKSLTVTRREYEQMRDEGWQVQMEQSQDAIHFTLEPTKPRPRRRRR